MPTFNAHNKSSHTHFLMRSSVTQISLISKLCWRTCARSSWYSPMVAPPMWHRRPIHLSWLSCCRRRRTVAKVTVVDTLNQISCNETWQPTQKISNLHWRLCEYMQRDSIINVTYETYFGDFTCHFFNIYMYATLTSMQCYLQFYIQDNCQR